MEMWWRSSVEKKKLSVGSMWDQCRVDLGSMWSWMEKYRE